MLTEGHTGGGSGEPRWWKAPSFSHAAIRTLPHINWSKDVNALRWSAPVTAAAKTSLP